LIYQTLVGTWPIEPLEADEGMKYRDRILQYTDKAMHEAKIHTSWMNPSAPHEAAVREFICDLFDAKGSDFTEDLGKFVGQIANSGFVNSLAQLVLKMIAPGVPDCYRGTELWDFNLVDPDNRRPVDYDARRQRLNNAWSAAKKNKLEFARDLITRWPDPDIKFWTTSACLNLRRDHPALFSFGKYVPLTACGKAANHILAFARQFEYECAIAIVPRNYYRLTHTSGSGEKASGPPRADWADTQIIIPDDFPQQWQCELSGQEIETVANNRHSFDVAGLLDVLPVAVLKSAAF
jgi:(1->4)-alpha-D-glucan 1-alpha-D-glucosylmutase